MIPRATPPIGKEKQVPTKESQISACITAVCEILLSMHLTALSAIPLLSDTLNFTKFLTFKLTFFYVICLPQANVLNLRDSVLSEKETGKVHCFACGDKILVPFQKRTVLKAGAWNLARRWPFLLIVLFAVIVTNSCRLAKVSSEEYLFKQVYFESFRL